LLEQRSGIEVALEATAEQPIARAPTAVCAFVGRTLRGPVNRAVTITSFAEYQGIFGGLWQPSPLSYAVEQFFDNGGGTAVVVRVVNAARAATLALRCGSEMLTLVAVAQGTREFLRAAVDYDGIGVNETDRFNLVLQRLRAPGSEYIEDQEIYRRLSVRRDSSRFVADALAGSALATVRGPVPAERPDPTLRADARALAGYVASNPDGDDGDPVTDYDVIGSAAGGRGIFALAGGPAFNFLYIPPLSRDTDVGASTLLVASRFCRDHRALLVIDPPLGWESAETALAGLRDWPFTSENALMYFPRVLAFDKLRGRFETFASGAAVAGMLARGDAQSPVWATAQGDDATLRPGFRPLCLVSATERLRLAQAGVNALQSVRPAAAQEPVRPRTLAGATAQSPASRWLDARRLALFVLNSVERGTRWMLFEPNELRTWQRATRQVEEFFRSLENEGAFADQAAHDRWLVVCDERVNRERDRDPGVISLLIGIPAGRAGVFQAWHISHRAGGSRVRSLTLNRVQLERGHIERAIEDLVGCA
jgi:phage tail sheath protein FI